MQPNIVFAFADDWGRYASAYRQVEGDTTPNALLDTPNFDRVAHEGALFTNAFVPAPSCTPCRSSLLTGRYFWQTGRGAILQGAVWDSSIPSYPLMLEEAGYHIGYTYKAWSPGTPRDAPYGGEEDAAPPGGIQDVAALIDWLKGRGGGFADAFDDLAVVRVAVNQEYVTLDHPVGPEDEVAFFPPVTGG